MKRVKRLISILLVAVMMLAMTTTVFADGADGEDGAYSITIDENILNGTVTSNPSYSADAGSSVTLTVTPDSGCSLGSLTVTGESGDVVGLTKATESNTYTFTMPAESVKVSATFVATPAYTITITNDSAGHVYEAYQIFAGTLSGTGKDDDPYVLSNITWGNGVDDDSSKTVAVNGNEYKGTLLNALETLKLSDASTPFAKCTGAADVAEVLGSSEYNTTDSELAKKFADVVGQYLSTSVAGKSSGSTLLGSTNYYNIGVASAGYYLVKDQDDSLANAEETAYTRYILLVVEDVEAESKDSVPSVVKKVYEESISSADDGYGEGYNDVADYDIGDDVPFKLIGTLPSNLSDYSTYSYIFHDTMAAGLTFNSDSVEVTIGSEKVNSSCYTVAVKDGSTEITDGCSFEVRFDDILSLKNESDKNITVSSTSEIVVTYTAKLNSNAVIGLDGNENKVYLEYSNNPNSGGERDTGETPEDKVIVFTYELDVTKANGLDSTNDDYKKLEGAEFVLYKKVDETVYYAVVDSNNKVTKWTDKEEDAAELTSNNDGVFKVIGLDDGTYYLKETKAPTGYNKLTSDVELVIAATTENGQSWTGTSSDALTALTISVDDGAAADGDTSKGIVAATIVNTEGSGLPVTGGMGTTILYIIGAILVIGAGVLLITRRRLNR